VTAVLALALVGVLPGAAQAAGEIPGGTTPGAAVALPIPGLNGSFAATNVGMPGVGLYSTGNGMFPFWPRVAWYTFTPAASGPLSVATSSSSYDTTLELWTSDGRFVTQNDDYPNCCNSRVNAQLAGGTTYRLGLGGWVGDQGTTVITASFTPQPPTAPQDLQAVAGDTTAVVTWNPPLDPSGDLLSYTLLCTPDGGTEVVCGQSFAPVPGEGPATSFTLIGLTNGTAYSVRLIAENVVGYSAPSGSAAVTPQAPSVTTVWTEPTALVSGDPFDVVIQVTSHDVAVPDGTIDVAIDGASYTDVPLVGGLVTMSMPAHLAGFVPVEVTYAGTAAILSGGADVAFEVVKRSQTVDFTALPAGLTYAGDPVTLAASSTFGLPVTFSASGACTVDGDVLTLGGVGDCTVVASQDGDSETEPASAGQTVSVGRRPQVLTLDELAPMIYGQTPVAVAAVSSVGLPVTVLAEGACALVDDELTTTGIGDCVATATQAGDALNAPAETVVHAAVVARRPDSITMSTFPALVRGNASIPVSATSLYDLPVTIVATGSCTFAGGFVSMMDVGTCTVTATSGGDEVTEPASAATSATVVAEPPSVLAQIVGQVGDPVAAASGWASGAWLRPGTALVLTVYSTPQGIGSIPARLDGTAAAAGTLPALAEGTHHLVARGTALDGTVVQDSLAFGVDEDGVIVWIGTAPRLAATGADVQEAGMLAVLWLITGASLLVIRRRFVLRRGAALA
jgi:hypothetical protein